MSTSQRKRKGLWKMSYGKIGTCLGALDKQGVTIDQFGRLDSDDELAKKVAEVFSVSTTNKYLDEEKELNYEYLSGYRPKSIIKQTNRLRELFSGIGYADEKLVEAELPAGAEGWFAIPRWKKIAPTYGKAVQKVFDLLKKTRNGKFRNYYDSQLGPQYLRQLKKSATSWKKLGDAQSDYNILVVPAQFGISHRGCGIRRVCSIMNENEFGLGAFAVAIMLLTHPERLQRYNDFYIDCAGDEFAPNADGNWSYTPVFGFDYDNLVFGVGWVGGVSSGFGSASACLIS